MKRTLTEREAEFAIAIREAGFVPDNELWGDFTDFTQAIAQIISGAELLIPPREMQRRFSTAWEAYAIIWGSEHDRIVRDCLGSQMFEWVRNHPNGRHVIRRILNRVVKVYGSLTPGMVVDIDVADIVEELEDTHELGEEYLTN